MPLAFFVCARHMSELFAIIPDIIDGDRAKIFRIPGLRELIIDLTGFDIENAFGSTMATMPPIPPIGAPADRKSPGVLPNYAHSIPSNAQPLPLSKFFTCSLSKWAALGALAVVERRVFPVEPHYCMTHAAFYQDEHHDIEHDADNVEAHHGRYAVESEQGEHRDVNREEAPGDTCRKHHCKTGVDDLIH